MKTVKKNQCLLGKYMDYFFAPIIKKKKDILGGGEAGGQEIPMLLKLSEFVKKFRLRTKVTNINFQYTVKLFILVSSLLVSF